ncbi:hypothetical protein ADUPG1_001457, partial [Aduncisulcus paluster]
PSLEAIDEALATNPDMKDIFALHNIPRSLLALSICVFGCPISCGSADSEEGLSSSSITPRNHSIPSLLFTPCMFSPSHLCVYVSSKSHRRASTSHHSASARGSMSPQSSLRLALISCEFLCLCDCEMHMRSQSAVKKQLRRREQRRRGESSHKRSHASSMHVHTNTVSDRSVSLGPGSQHGVSFSVATNSSTLPTHSLAIRAKGASSSSSSSFSSSSSSYNIPTFLYINDLLKMCQNLSRVSV